ncbi:MAG TPA: TRAP transporter substrate-binding protein DctP [Alphaproteobacteria bacterium]|jgi:TRAP-type C4-dicarboxylate transport system substrate-binding protein
MMAKVRMLALAAALAAMPVAATAQQATLKVVSFVPKQVGYSQTLQKLFVDKVNGDPKSPIKIDFAGGPEVTPPSELGRAVKAGVIDMQLGPPGLWLNLVPEGDAIFGSNLTPAERRANGGMDLLNQIFAKKLNSTILGHAAGGFGFHIFLKDKPKLAADGNLDLKGVKIRVAPAWRDFVQLLGGTGIVTPAPEVYTALERGTVDGTGWPINGLRDFGWNKFVKYRVDPQFMQTDVLLIINNEKLNTLSPAQKAYLLKAGLDYEKESYAAEARITKDEDAKLRAAGMEVVELKGEGRKKYLAAAYAIPWKRLKERDASNYDALRAKFYKAE